MDDDVSKLEYMEVLYQLQAMELIAQKGPLSEGNLTLLDELEARKNDIIQAKLAQTFDGAPRSAYNLDNSKDWSKAAKDTEFKATAEALARRHLQVFVDVASGNHARRSGLEQVRALLRKGDVLVVWRLDRLGRSLKQLIEFMTELSGRCFAIPGEERS